MPRQLSLSSPTLWKRNRIIVLESANYTCSKCGKPTKTVHHIDGKRTDHSLNNLVPLCSECHVTLHYKMGSISPVVYNNQYSAGYRAGSMQVTFNTRIDHQLAQWLDAHSKATGIPKAQIVAKALEDYKKLYESKNA